MAKYSVHGCIVRLNLRLCLCGTKALVFHLDDWQDALVCFIFVCLVSFSLPLSLSLFVFAHVFGYKSVYFCVMGTCRDQKKPFYALELELQFDPPHMGAGSET